MADEKIELDAQDASAGKPVGAMRYVLGISMALVIVIFAVMVFR